MNDRFNAAMPATAFSPREVVVSDFAYREPDTGFREITPVKSRSRQLAGKRPYQAHVTADAAGSPWEVDSKPQPDAADAPRSETRRICGSGPVLVHRDLALKVTIGPGRFLPRSSRSPPFPRSASARV